MKYPKHLLFLLFLFFLPGGFVFSQLMNNRWAFGFGSQLNFSVSPPIGQNILPISASEGSASISDPVTGVMLFYTDGVTVWNTNNSVMQNGTGLLGGDPALLSSTAAAVIVPKPQSSTQYYIICVDDQDNTNVGLTYSLVDMTLDGGLGGIVAGQKNMPLYAGNSEKLHVVPNACQDGYWVLTAGADGNSIAAFEVLSSGIVTTPVISSTNAYLNTSGHIKVNRQGTKLVVANFFQGGFELYDFNNSTGTVSNPLAVSTPFSLSPWYAFEFSPDGSRLYAANTIQFYQFTIGSGNAATITASAVNIPVLSGSSGGIQLGQDDKIYALNGGVYQIPNPNNAGNAIGPITPIANIAGFYGLPQWVYQLPENTISYPGAPYSTLISVPQIPNISLPPGGTFSSTTGLSIDPLTGAINPSLSVPGTYLVTYTTAPGCPPATTTVTIITPVSYTPPCASSGNWILFSNYDGGKLNIVVDENIPNLKIGICTYEPVIVNISGQYAANVTRVLYAGTNSSANNNHCGFPISTSSINGVSPSIISILVVPPVTIISPPNPNNLLNQPNGFNYGIVTAISCDVTTYQGGGNTIDQVVDYFQTQFGGSLRGLKVQYCCWLDSLPYRVSDVSLSCCSNNSTGIANINYPAGPFCNTTAGFISPVFSGDSTGTFYANPPGLALNPNNGIIDQAASAPGTYTITYLFGDGCTTPVQLLTDTVVILSGTPFPPVFQFPNPICISSGPQAVQPLANFFPGGTFTSTPAGLSIDPATGTITPGSSLPGGYAVTYTTPVNSCAGQQSFSLPDLSIIPEQTPYNLVLGDTCISSPVSVQLSGTSGVQSISWNMGNPAGGSTNTSVSNTHSHLYSQPGNYTITAIVQYGCGTDTIQRVIQVVPATLPTLTFSYPDTACNTLTNLTPVFASGFSTGGTFSCSPALPINASNGTISAFGGQSGTYILTYTYTGVGCQQSGVSSDTLEVASPLAANFSLTYPNPLCAGGGIVLPQLSGTYNQQGVFTSNFSGVNATTGALNLATANAGTYTITYTSNQGNCLLATSFTDTLRVGDVQLPVVSFSFPDTICNNVLQQLPVTSSGFVSGGIFSSPGISGLNPSTGALAPQGISGNFSVTYTVSSDGCDNGGNFTDNFFVRAFTAATPAFSYPNVCLGKDSVQVSLLTGHTGGGIYSSGALSVDSIRGTVFLQNKPAGTYNVSYSVSNKFCLGNAVITKQVTIEDSTLNLEFSYPENICNNAKTSLLSDSDFPFGGTFKSPDFVDAQSGTLSPAITDTGKFVVLYDFPGSQCKRSATLAADISITNCDSSLIVREIFIPDGFTPNSDGVNDVLYVRGSLKTFDFFIYNRWGEQVFFTNQQKQGWDGNFKGAPLDPGVFVYYLKGEDYKGNTINSKGNITLIR